MSELLTTGQAARLLGVSKPTVVRAVQRGMLRPALVTPGQHRRFRRDDLIAFRSRILGGEAEGEEQSDAAVEIAGQPVVRPVVRRVPTGGTQ
jgi:excisionase family DNA binding protein